MIGESATKSDVNTSEFATEIEHLAAWKADTC